MRNDPLPVVKHLRMLTEKVAKNVYTFYSLFKYDAAVHKRAGKKFGLIQPDEMFTYFTYDNTVKASTSQRTEASLSLDPRTKNGATLYVISVQNEGCALRSARTFPF